MTDVQRFFQRPVVEAMEWKGDNFDEIVKWGRDRRHPVQHYYIEGGLLTIWWNDEKWTAAVGDWVVYSPCCGWSTWAGRVESGGQVQTILGGEA